MGKLSLLPQETSFGLSDFLVKSKNGAAGDVIVSLQNFLAAISPAWTSYTPVWGSSGTAPVIGNGTIVGSYLQIGKRVDYKFLVTFGSTTTFGTGNYTFTLPTTTAAGLAAWFPMGTWMGTASGTVLGVLASWQSNTTVSGLNHSTSTSGAQASQVGTTAPVTWASTNVIYFAGSYESL